MILLCTIRSLRIIKKHIIIKIDEFISHTQHKVQYHQQVQKQ